MQICGLKTIDAAYKTVKTLFQLNRLVIDW
jgi:hypothetical protein